MSKFLIHPSYFPSIATFAVLAQKDIVWEAHDIFQKQTYRNRCYICTDQGKHMLNIPIKHVGGNEGRQKYREVQLDHSSNWLKQHWRTLETAYRTSPFFEYYEDDLKPLFETQLPDLFDFNLRTIQVVSNCLGIAFTSKQTSNFEMSPNGFQDLRFLVNAKKTIVSGKFPEYTQVFGERHGFLSNLSILDLLFNEGTNAAPYLQSLSLDFLDA